MYVQGVARLERWPATNVRLCCDFYDVKSARVKILEVHNLLNSAMSMNYQLSGAAEARKLSPRSHSPKFNH
jgi:hypothetical protein